MKKTIKLYHNKVRVETIDKEIDLPEVAKYYSRNDEGKWFPRGLILFAIIPDYPPAVKSYTLVQVERNKQDYNDFHPAEDCYSEFWKKESLRGTALDIIMNEWSNEFEEITEEEFNIKREELLNKWRE